MPSGTILNGVEVYRVHRTNAQFVIEEGEARITDARQSFIAMSVMTPKTDFNEIIMRVNDVVDDIVESAVNIRLAQHIIDFPDECVEDYDEPEVVK